MARKTREETDKTHALLLDAAEQVFSEQGYANASFQQIAERAGMTRGAIYWHFRDKDQLLEAVLHRGQLSWDRLPAQFAALQQPLSPRQMGELIGHALQETVHDPRQHRVTLIMLHRTELVTDNHQVYSRLTTILDRIKRCLIAALSARYRYPDGSPHRNIPVAASAVKTLLTGTVYEWLLNQAEVDLAQIPQTVERLISSFFEHDALAA